MSISQPERPQAVPDPAPGSPHVRGSRRGSGGQRRTLREWVYSHLRDTILSGRYGYGRRLTEVEVARDLGVSRTPVREAFRNLELEGLVQYESRRGVRVTYLGADDMVEIYSVMVALEGMAAGLAARNIQAHERRELLELLERMEAAMDAPDPELAAGYHRAFNDLIFRAARNKRLYDLINRYIAYIERIQTLSWPRRSDTIRREHRAIAEAIVAGDAAEAERRMREHVEHSREAYRMAQQEASPSRSADPGGAGSAPPHGPSPARGAGPGRPAAGSGGAGAGATDVLAYLEAAGALARGHFRLRSGRHTEVYLLGNVAFQTPHVVDDLAGLLVARLEPPYPDVIFTPSTTAAAFGYAVARLIGARFLIPSELAPPRLSRGERVLIVDDVLDTGATIRDAARWVTSVGGRPDGAAVLVDRSTGGTAEPGLRVLALARVPIASYTAEECPLCRQGIPWANPGPAG